MKNLYCIYSIPYDVGLKAFKKTLDKREQKDPLNMVEFVLKSYFFEF